MKAPEARSENMRLLYMAGSTLAEIGALYGLSRQRIQQILVKLYGIGRREGGVKVRTAKKRDAFIAARDARTQSRFGCSWAEYQRILKHPDHPTVAFITQRMNASVRGIAWELTLWQWWKAWEQSGHWPNRGRGRSYCMCRLNDVGPYSVDNIYIATGVENISDHWSGRRESVAA